MRRTGLKKIACKLFDNSLPDKFIDFLVDEMKSNGRILIAPSESMIWRSHKEFSSLK